MSALRRGNLARRFLRFYKQYGRNDLERKSVLPRVRVIWQDAPAVGGKRRQRQINDATRREFLPVYYPIYHSSFIGFL
jgi:hypothetical protein